MVKIAIKINNIELLQQNSKKGVWGYTFLKNPLYLEKFQKKQAFIPGYSTKLSGNPWKFRSRKPRPMEITRFFLVHAWKSHFFFNWPPEFPHVLCSIPLKIPCPQPHSFLDFFWNSSFWKVLAKKPTQKQPKITVSAGTNI